MAGSDGVREMASALIGLCARNGLMIATAESCTGGMVAAALTDIPGSSAVVERGFVTYSNEAKSECLGVPAALIAAHGAVSGPVACAMAEGALARSAPGGRHNRHRRPGRRVGGEARGPRPLRLRPAWAGYRARPRRVRPARPRRRAPGLGGEGTRDASGGGRGALTQAMAPS